MKILLVDDDVLFCRNFERFFLKHGLTAKYESEGKKAIARIKSESPDILILDIELKLGKITGKTICDFIHKQSEFENQEMRIILISGIFKSEGDQISGYYAGADAYLTKPFALDNLLALVRSQARRMSTEKSPDHHNFDDRLIIDKNSHMASMDGTELNLTKLEYRLLYYLASAHGEYRTKASILNSVWGETVVEENALQRAIHALRKKLSDAALSSENYIETVHGVGYRFLTMPKKK